MLCPRQESMEYHHVTTLPVAGSRIRFVDSFIGLLRNNIFITEYTNIRKWHAKACILLELLHYVGAEIPGHFIAGSKSTWSNEFRLSSNLRESSHPPVDIGPRRLAQCWDLSLSLCFTCS